MEQPENYNCIIIFVHVCMCDCDYRLQIYEWVCQSSSEFEGSGVGLAIVKKVMQRHGGAVSMRGDLNKGATITLTFRE